MEYKGLKWSWKEKDEVLRSRMEWEGVEWNLNVLEVI